MNVSLTFTDFQAALEFREQTGADYQICGCETQLNLPKTLGEGRIRHVNLRDGLELFVQKHLLEESLSLEFLPALPDSSQVFLKFCLSGSLSGSLREADTNLCVASGNHLLAYCSNMAGTVDLVSGSEICTVELLIARQLFQSMTNSQEPHPVAQQLINADVVPSHYQFGKTNALMAIALQQILHCPYQGATRQLYLDKGLELIALYLETLKEQLEPQPHPLKPDDVRRIHQAKEILICQSNTPPSLLALARQVGINDCKLKRGFRQVFGTTVFGYLHNYRMERAAKLLQENRMTVTGVACAVGFANRSSFAAAFRRKFGVNPSDYLTAYRKQYWIKPKNSR